MTGIGSCSPAINALGEVVRMQVVLGSPFRSLPILRETGKRQELLTYGVDVVGLLLAPLLAPFIEPGGRYQAPLVSKGGAEGRFLRDSLSTSIDGS